MNSRDKMSSTATGKRRAGHPASPDLSTPEPQHVKRARKRNDVSLHINHLDTASHCSLAKSQRISPKARSQNHPRCSAVEVACMLNLHRLLIRSACIYPVLINIFNHIWSHAQYRETHLDYMTDLFHYVGYSLPRSGKH